MQHFTISYFQNICPRSPTFIQCRFSIPLFKLNLWDYSSVTDTLRYYQAFSTRYVPWIYLTSDNKAILSQAQTLSLNEYLQDPPVVIVIPEQDSCSISCLGSGLYQMLPKKGKTTHNAIVWTCNSVPLREDTSWWFQEVRHSYSVHIPMKTGLFKEYIFKGLF